jgi:hypothetical protein
MPSIGSTALALISIALPDVSPKAAGDWQEEEEGET